MEFAWILSIVHWIVNTWTDTSKLHYSEGVKITLFVSHCVTWHHHNTWPPSSDADDKDVYIPVPASRLVWECPDIWSL